MCQQVTKVLIKSAKLSGFILYCHENVGWAKLLDFRQSGWRMPVDEVTSSAKAVTHCCGTAASSMTAGSC